MILTPGQLATRGDFYFQIASLLTAGIPLIQALETALTHTRSFRKRLAVTVTQLQAGATFGEALDASENTVPVFDRAVLAAGEQSGRLDATLRMLGNYYQERARLLRRIVSDLAYPFFLLHLAIFIFPTSLLGKLFLNGGVQTFFIQKAAVLLPFYAVIFFGIAALQGNRSENWRGLMERILNAVPFVAGARKSLALARFSAGLEALLSAGVPIIQAWEIAARASGSHGIKRGITWAVPKLESGMLPSEALRQLPVFPEMFSSLYATGEVSGQLDATLQRLHHHYEEQATLKFQNISQWAPKLIFLVVAVAIGYQIVSFYSNYFAQLGNLNL